MRIIQICILFLLLGICKVDGQVYHFYYEMEKLDTMKFDVDSVFRDYRIPVKMTRNRFFVRSSNILIEGNTSLSPFFKNIPRDPIVHYPEGISSISPHYLNFVIECKQLKIYDFHTEKFYKYPNISILRIQKINDHQTKLFLTENIYFVIDSELNAAINPGLIIEGLNFGIYEIKTAHTHLKLGKYWNSRKYEFNAEISEILKQMNYNTPDKIFNLFFVNDNLPTEKIKGTKIN